MEVSKITNKIKKDREKDRPSQMVEKKKTKLKPAGIQGKTNQRAELTGVTVRMNGYFWNITSE